MEKLLAPTTQINLCEVEGSVMMLREQLHFSAKLFDNAVTKSHLRWAHHLSIQRQLEIMLLATEEIAIISKFSAVFPLACLNI